MTNQEWCLLVLKKFFPALVTDQTFVSPALAKITGEIWQDWQQIEPFAQSLPTTPQYGALPGPSWLGQVLGSAIWRKFTADPYSVTPAVRARIQTKYGDRVSSAVSTGKDIDQL